jgi:hypothetical protein
MNDGKIASIKLVSGEEIICMLLGIENDGSYTVLSFTNPLRIQLRDRRRNKRYSLEPWLCLKNDSIHCIDVTKIITVNEIVDEDVLSDYNSYYKKKINLMPKPKRSIRTTNKIGYVGNTNDFKDVLEKLYNDTDSYEKPTDV